MADPNDPLVPEDPFAESEADRERERRRLEREEGRKAGGGGARERSTRRSLGDRVSGALGAATDALSGRSDAGRSDADPSPEAPELEPPQAPATPEPTAPEPHPKPEPAEPWPGEDDADVPFTDENDTVRATGIPVRGRPEPAQRDVTERSAQAILLRRRLLAGAAVIGVVVAIFAVLKIAGGGDSAPVPAPAKNEVKNTFALTIPEGLTREQISTLVKKETNLKGSYEKATATAPKGFSLKEYGAQDAPSLEGFLFPATYDLERKSPAASLVSRQLEAFGDNLAQVNLKAAEKKNLTPYDVVIIASMIEREIAVPEERKLAAAVIYNRLADGEPLGIDATLRYELDNFDKPLLESELQAPTPYNTRINAGLPPTPIGNPGLASLEAAANPAKSDVRFYVIKPGSCNEHVFTADAAEFEQAQADYQAALEAEGGSPTQC